MELFQRLRVVSCVNPERADISEIEVLLRFSSLSCVNPERVDVSEIRICVSHNVLSCVSPESGEKSDTVLLLTTRFSASMYAPLRFRNMRLWACSRPVRFAMPRLGTSRSLRFSSVCVVIALPISSRIAAAKFGSGMDTLLGAGSRLLISTANSSVVMSPCLSITSRKIVVFVGPKTVVTNSTVPFEVLLNSLQLTNSANPFAGPRSVCVYSCAWCSPSGSVTSKRKRIAFGGAARLGESISITARLFGVLEETLPFGLKARWMSNCLAVHSEIWF